MSDENKNIAHAFTEGRINCEIESKEGKNGQFYSCRFFRIWKKEEEDVRMYSFTTSERGDDLEDLARATATANNWIQLQAEQAPEAAA